MITLVCEERLVIRMYDRKDDKGNAFLIKKNNYHDTYCSNFIENTYYEVYKMNLNLLSLGSIA